MKQKIYLYHQGAVYTKMLDHTHKSVLSVSAHGGDITLPEALIGSTSLTLAYRDSAWHLQDTVITEQQPLQLLLQEQTVGLYLTSRFDVRVYDVSMRPTWRIGYGDTHDVSLPSDQDELCAIVTKLGDGIQVEPRNEKAVYVNQRQITAATMCHFGDQIVVEQVELILRDGDVAIYHHELPLDVKLPFLRDTLDEFPEDYPKYQRSPRIIYREPTDKIHILTPPNPPEKPSEHLVKLLIPPIATLGGTILMTWMMPNNGLFRLIGMVTTVIATVTSIVTYLNNRKKYKVDTKARMELYQKYLIDKALEIGQRINEQKHARLYHFPTIQQLTHSAQALNKRLFEKTVYHHDFLEYRVGIATIDPSFAISFDTKELEEKRDVLVDEGAALKKEYSQLPNMPLSVSLMEGPVGYVGPRHLVMEQLELLVGQLSFFHSYHDVELMMLFPQAEKAQLEWMRWLPHMQLKAVNIRGMVYHDRSRDQVLGSLYQILKDRRQSLDEAGRKAIQFTPHYVVMVSESKFLLDHPVLELLNGDPSNLGVSIIFVEEVIENLSEHVKTIVDIRTSKEGTIILEAGKLVNRKFRPDHFPQGYAKESLSRALAPIEHVQNLTNTIPEKVTFMELYEASTLDELGVTKRWAENSPHKSLAVPLGLRGKDDLVYLNLHEKAHGPHGLVAGTTGSGKSEIIQSYILSLAVNFHPYEVAFLLIDYKGGGMANLFKDLPHHLGSITNLDGAQSMRALISIKAELQKRQRLFSEYEVNHINQYQKLYKEQPEDGKTMEPMPHLFLISDEFAELKSEQPEFMKELVSTARIGRSLGIHLILATQKPSGVVDDQIWSNSKFKLALKVQNASDSNEIIKTPDAANITLPGRAYLQVGNNEIYELFQSAWSGADYLEEKEDTYYVDDTIYRINELGQYDILSEDLSGLEKMQQTLKVPSELEAIIDYLDVYTKEHKIAKLARPWLPPLPTNYTVEAATTDEAVTKPRLKITIGLLDKPHIQAQVPFELDLTKDGHLAIFGSPGFGKSTMIQTMCMQFARSHTPEQLHFYLLDFGTNGLMPLRNLPHVADFIMVDEVEKVGKFTRIMLSEMKRRKAILSEYGVASLNMYEQMGHEPLPEIVIVIDNYEAIKEAGFVEGFEPLLIQMGREGSSLGIHIIAAGTKSNSIKAQLLGTMKLQASLFIIDKSDTTNIVGRSDFTIEEIHGRGLIKLDKPTLFQVGLPVEGESGIEVIQGVQAEAKQLNKDWTGNKPKGIPMVPEVLTYEDFMAMESVQEAVQDIGKVSIGIDYEQAESVTINFDDTPLVQLLGNTLNKERVLKTMIETTGPDVEILIMNCDHIDFIMSDNVHIGHDKDSYIATLKPAMKEYLDAIDEYEAKRSEDPTLLAKDVLPTFKKRLLLITDSKNFVNSIHPKFQELIAKALKYAKDLNLQVVFGNIPSNNGITSGAIGEIVGTCLISIVVAKIGDVPRMNLSQNRFKEPDLKIDEANLVKDGSFSKLKLVEV